MCAITLYNRRLSQCLFFMAVGINICPFWAKRIFPTYLYSY
nr:MAG TPA: hypothetical protein [Caudoviricetes sp.]